MKKSLQQPTSTTNSATATSKQQTSQVMNQNVYQNYNNQAQQQQYQQSIGHTYGSNVQNTTATNFQQYRNDEIDIDDIDTDVLDRLLGEYSFKSLIM